MANRKSADVSKVLMPDEVSKIFHRTDVLYNSLVNVERKACASTLYNMISDYYKDFKELYEHGYRDSIFGMRDEKKAQKALNDMKKMDKSFVEKLCATEEGYCVLAEIERFGVKVDWNSVPLTAITTKKCINFLAKKGYDFDAMRSVNGVEIDFTGYNLANLYMAEKNTIKSYDDLLAQKKEYDKYEDSLRKYAVEYKSPKTSPERKEEIMEYFNSIVPEFNKKQKEMRTGCDRVMRQMIGYYVHAGCLEAVAVDHQYVSPENIKRIDPKNLSLGIEYMNGRLNAVKQIREKFSATERTSTNVSSDDSLALIGSLIQGNGVSSLLASAENGKAVYAKEAEAEKSGMSMTERLAQQTQGSTLENAENAMAFVGKDSQTNA